MTVFELNRLHFKCIPDEKDNPKPEYNVVREIPLSEMDKYLSGKKP
jgi:hypothetical protein